jgi:hypothetical protein
MDKKLVMQEIYDGRIQTLEKFDELLEKLNDQYCGLLKKFRQSQEGDIVDLLSGEAFWDMLTEERIAYEQETYLNVKKTVDKLAKLVDDLYTYVDVMTE